MAAFRDFDESTTSFLCELYRAWRSNAALSTYIRMRDGLLAQHEDVSTRIVTLAAVVNIACQNELTYQRTSDLRWEETFEIAACIEARDNDIDSAPQRKRKQSYNESARTRNLALVSALWSPEIVWYYGWNVAAQGQLKLLRACALQYPRFTEDFCTRLNAVLLSRHCEAIAFGHQRSLVEAPLQPHRDFDLDLLASAHVDEKFERQWIINNDGAIPIDVRGALLRDLRPHHVRLYLLQKDKFGMLVPRQEDSINPALLQIPAAASSNGPDGAMEMDTVPVGSLTLQSLNGILPATMDTCANSEPYTPLPLELPERSAVVASCPGMRIIDTLGNSSAAAMSTSPLLSTISSSDFSSISEEVEEETQSIIGFESVSQACSVTASSEVVQDSASVTETGPEEVPGRTAGQLVPSTSGKRKRRSQLALGDQEQERGICYSQPSSSEHHPSQASLRPASLITSSNLSSPPVPMLSTPPFQDRDNLTLEASLHNRHCKELMLYAKKLSKAMSAASPGGLLCTRQAWLQPSTRWAKIWSSNGDILPRGSAGSAQSAMEAEVLYYTSDDIVLAASTGQTFKKPIVIKEKFSDSGMHKVQEFTALLQDASTQNTLRVRGLHDKQPESMMLIDFITTARSPQKSSNGLNARNLRNITKAHRPLFTLLPRFRLLETLAERVASDLEKLSEAKPQDVVSCIGFNTLSLEGAFLGAHVDSLSGTWVRILDGVQYWMIIPPDEMEHNWEDFVIHGDDWLPYGSERLIVLEQDDVLLLPPGSRIVHAVHSPTRCLVQGGMLWDELNLIDTLTSVHWICKHQMASQEGIARHLPRIVMELEKLVQIQPYRFPNGQPLHDYQTSFHNKMDALLDSGGGCASEG